MQQQQEQDQLGLITIAKNGGMVFGGTISSTVLVFALSVLIAKHINQGEFGFFTLCLVIVKNLALISGLGFRQGLPRYIPYQLGKNEYRKAWSSIVSSFVITFLLSTFFALLLFLNADLRRPNLHQLFGLTYNVGLTDLLLKNIEMAKVIPKSGVEGLSILTTGSTPRDSGLLIKSNRMRNIVRSLEEHYDVLLFHPAPLLIKNDAVLLMNYLDKRSIH